MMDFAVLPPEINSARMYSGPGAASTLAAAAAWNEMATEMRSTAASYSSVVTALTDESWLGPASMSMLAAVGPYLAWLGATANQAEQAGAQANAFASAYESAFAMTVPPASVANNRAQLSKLLATNIFGQNVGAIAANEAQYAEMWAQDGAAMNGYANAASSAAQLTPFSVPKPAANANAVANQADAVAQAAAPAATPNASASLSGLFAWLGLAPNTNTSTTGLAGLMNFLDGSNGTLLGSILNNASTANLSNAFTTSGLMNPTSFIDSVTAYNFLFPAATGAGAAPAASELATSVGQGTALGGAGGPGLASSAMPVGVGRASLVGTLAVPPGWAAAGATISPVATTTRLGASAYQGLLGTTPMVTEEVGPMGMPGMPLSSVAGAAEEENAPLYGFRPRVMARPPFAG